MNEDDTFNRLRRTPIDKMVEIIVNYRLSGVQGDLTHVLLGCGWTVEDYRKERIIYFGKHFDE